VGRGRLSEQAGIDAQIRRLLSTPHA